MKITHKHIEEILDFQISDSLRNKIDKFDLRYRELTADERDVYILNFVNVLTNDITKSGEHRLVEWESGWGENLSTFIKTKNIKDIIPMYHGKNKIVKWMGEPVLPLTENFDYKIHISFVDAILQHYMKDVKNIFEFGCGPGYHLTRLREFNKDIGLHGCDWTIASQEIIHKINELLGTNIKCSNFDFFNPDYSLNIPESSGIYTIAALEQVGDNFKDMIDFLIAKNTELCIHMEPIDELLDSNKLIDNLSIKYFRKRNYLNKFLTYLERLESDGKIVIIKKQRIFTGSYFTEGHSLIVWKPKTK